MIFKKRWHYISSTDINSHCAEIKIVKQAATSDLVTALSQTVPVETIIASQERKSLVKPLLCLIRKEYDLLD